MSRPADSLEYSALPWPVDCVMWLIQIADSCLSLVSLPHSLTLKSMLLPKTVRTFSKVSEVKKGGTRKRR